LRVVGFSPNTAVLLIADRRLEADRLLGDLQHLAHLLQGHSRPAPRAFGSRPISCSIWREVRTSLLIVSIICTGMRIVRAWSAIERVIA
jgi:hypothetical protein